MSTAWQEEIAFKLYAIGAPWKDIIKKSGVHQGDFTKLLQRKGLYKHRDTSIKLKDGHHVMTNDLAYIIGVLKGDGYTSPTGLELGVVDNEFMVAFADAILRQFGLYAVISERPASTMTCPLNGKQYEAQRIVRANICSTHVSRFFKRMFKEHTLDQLTLLMNPSQKIALLRGIFDSEGCVWSNYVHSRHEYHYRITVTHKTHSLCATFQRLITEAIKMKSYITNGKSGMYDWFVSRRAWFKPFYEIIQPTIHRKRERFEAVIFERGQSNPSSSESVIQVAQNQ